MRIQERDGKGMNHGGGSGAREGMDTRNIKEVKQME